MKLLLPTTLSSGHFSPRFLRASFIALGIRTQSVTILKTQPFAAYRTTAQSGPDENDPETSYEEMPLFLFRADGSNPSPWGRLSTILIALLVTLRKKSPKAEYSTLEICLGCFFPLASDQEDTPEIVLGFRLDYMPPINS